jgi:hypothetical protein
MSGVFNYVERHLAGFFERGDMPVARLSTDTYRTQMYFHASSGIWSTAPVFERYVRVESETAGPESF